MFQKEHRLQLLKHFRLEVRCETLRNVLFFGHNGSVLSETYFTFFSPKLPCKILCPCTYVLQPGLPVQY